MRKLSLGILIFIVLFGAFLRLYRLGSVPGSLDWDEASWGYNAYSLMKTGKDEYGMLLPTSFRSFGDYKQPVYGYLTAGSEMIFGVTAYAVRFPSALLGTISILCFFFFLRELFLKTKQGELIALLGSASYAVSPWAIQFSRVAFEANVALSFVIIGFSLFLYGIRRKGMVFATLGTFFLGLSEYTYHSEKLITPLIFTGVLAFSIVSFKPKKNLLFVPIIVFTVMSVLWLFDFRTTVRGRSVIFTSNPTQALGRSVEEMIYEKSLHLPLASVIHNRRLVYLETFAAHYVSHFAPTYLFITGDNDRHHAPGMGILYLLSLPFILIGIVVGIKKYPRESGFLLLWLLLAPLASALTIDPPNAARNLMMAPVWDAFIGIGLYSFYTVFIERKYYLFISPIITILIICNVVYYIHQYFIHTNKEFGRSWQYGYKQAMLTVDELKNTHRHIYVTNTIEQGYVYYLFYTRYDPKTYFTRPGATAENQECRKIDTIYFGRCPVKLEKGDLYVTSGGAAFHGKELTRINYPNGERAVTIYEHE